MRIKSPQANLANLMHLANRMRIKSPLATRICTTHVCVWERGVVWERVRVCERGCVCERESHHQYVSKTCVFANRMHLANPTLITSIQTNQIPTNSSNPQEPCVWERGFVSTNLIQLANLMHLANQTLIKWIKSARAVCVRERVCERQWHPQYISRVCVFADLIQLANLMHLANRMLLKY